MRHLRHGGRGRHPFPLSGRAHLDDPSGHHRHRHHSHHPEGGHRGPHRGGRRHGGRLFDYGELRLLLLALIAERPRHGYELIKGIEERLGGSYSPSPGVIYPTLSWLDDMGYAVVEAGDPAASGSGGGRKRYRITPEGEAFLAANRAAVDALLARVGQAAAEGADPVPAPLVRAMHNLKLAMRLRLRQGPIGTEAAEAIAAALDAAAQTVERSR